jgi:hypothetical protein
MRKPGRRRSRSEASSILGERSELQPETGRSAPPSPQKGLHFREVDSNGVQDSKVRQFPPVAELVDRRRTDTQQLGHLSHREELAHRPQGFVDRCRAVQQGSSKIFARDCMDLHILAFLVGHTSRICTGLHVLARIRRYVNILYESAGHWFKSSRARQM